MGCFSRCFGRCSNGYKKIGSHNYHEKLPVLIPVTDQKIESATEAQITDHLKIVAEKVDNNEDQLNSNGEQSFRTQIEECGNQTAAGEEEEEGSVTELQEVLHSEEEAEGKKQAEEISDSSEKEETTGGGRTREDSEDEILSDSSDSSLFTYPTTNKYSERNAESDGIRSTMIQEEESYESLFSVSIDSRRQSFTPGIEIEGDGEVSSSSRPFIEDNNKWKTVRRKVASTMNNQEQENVIITDSGELTVGRRTSSNRCRNGVDDTSLSSWLVESENEPDQEKNSSSPLGSVGTSSLKENRPILGELTIDELNHMSRHSSSSPPKRRSSPRFFNPNETPILGTVGSYWKHTGGGNQLPMDAAVSGSTMSENCRMNNQTNNTL